MPTTDTRPVRLETAGAHVLVAHARWRSLGLRSGVLAGTLATPYVPPRGVLEGAVLDARHDRGAMRVRVLGDVVSASATAK
jgi:hypothetical protein